MTVHCLQAGYNVEIDTTYDCKKRFTIPITKHTIKLTMTGYQFTTHQRMLYIMVDDVATAVRLVNQYQEWPNSSPTTPETKISNLVRSDALDWQLDQQIDIWFQTPPWDIYGHMDFKAITFEMID